jgi:chemotaxis protein methyltransferase CheR
MYLTPGHAQALVRHLAQGLCPGGFLFLGAAETLRGLSQAFHLRHTHGSFYYQLAGARPAQALPEAPPSQTIWSVAAWAGLNDSPAWLDTIQQSAARVRELSSVAQASACAGIAQPAAANRWNSAAVLDLFRRERFGEALEQVSRRPPESAGDPDALLLEALLLTQQGRLEQARRTCRQLLEVDELNAQAHYVMGLCQAESWHHHKVAAYLDPSFAMPRLHLGLHARKQGQRETAHRELKQAIALLQQEDPARILLFGGGFSREALIALCRAEIQACGGGS